MNIDDNVGLWTEVLFSNSVLPFCVLDSDGNISQANKACVDLIVEYPISNAEESADVTSELLGKPFEQFLGPQSNPKSFKLFLQKLAADKAGFYDSLLLRKTVGCYRWHFQRHEQKGKAFFIGQGLPVGEGDSMYGKYAGSSFVLLSGLTVVGANQAFFDLLGLEDTADLYGKEVSEFASAQSKVKLENVRDWTTGELELTLNNKEGIGFPVKALCRTQHYQAGESTVLIVSPKAEWSGSMLKAEKLFNTIFSNAVAPMVVMATNGYIYELNDAFVELTGYTYAELIQTLAVDLVYKPDRIGLKSIGKKMLAGKRQSYSKDIRLKKKSKRLIWVRKTTTILNLNEEERYFLISWENIDRHKRAERQLSQRAEELERTNAELEHFAYVASHDLKEPLRTISSFLQLIKKRYYNKLDSDANDYINYTIESTGRLNNLIKNLLDYSRTREFPDAKEPVDLNELLEQVNGNLKEVSEASNANLLSEHLPVVKVNRVQMAQLFQNLIDNAIKFSQTGETPEVLISVDEMQNQYNFSVQDNGIGIKAEDNGKIFGIFNRLHDRSVYKGAGIGLAVCKRIVENHGGRIWAEPAESKGAKFCFTLMKEA